MTQRATKRPCETRWTPASQPLEKLDVGPGIDTVDFHLFSRNLDMGECSRATVLTSTAMGHPVIEADVQTHDRSRSQVLRQSSWLSLSMATVAENCDHEFIRMSVETGSFLSRLGGMSIFWHTRHNMFDQIHSLPGMMLPCPPESNEQYVSQDFMLVTIVLPCSIKEFQSIRDPYGIVVADGAVSKG